MEAGVLHHGSPPVTLHLTFLKQDLFLNLELADLARLASLQTPRDLPVSASQCLGYRYTSLCPDFFLKDFYVSLKFYLFFFMHECSVSTYTCVPEECVQLS